MSTIVLRNTKGSALTFTEGDANFTNLNNDKLELADLSVGAEGSASGDGSIAYNNTTGVFTYTPPDLSTYLTSYTETDPVVGAITGIVKADGAGNISAATAGSDYLASETFTSVAQDTTPQLGGDLDGQGNKVEDVELDNYKETIYTGGSTTGTITPDVANGNVQSITLTGSITFNAFSNPETGQSMTLIVKQSGSGGETLTSTMKFAGGEKTLSTAGDAIDIISVVYDGTNYYASLATDFS